MSKKRLDMIKKHAEHKVLRNHKNEIRHEMTEIKTVDYDWLIEQAERVQELERKLELTDRLKDIQINQKNIAHETNEILEQQNKRYREAIEIAIHNIESDDNIGIHFALSILKYVMESDEECTENN